MSPQSGDAPTLPTSQEEALVEMGLASPAQGRRLPGSSVSSSALPGGAVAWALVCFGFLRDAEPVSWWAGGTDFQLWGQGSGGRRARGVREGGVLSENARSPCPGSTEVARQPCQPDGWEMGVLALHWRVFPVGMCAACGWAGVSGA